ncbi:MAG: oligopeptide/dipeptide ABC transporter ATP-binding protein [Wenzhouxiangellaceae bacterium]
MDAVPEPDPDQAPRGGALAGEVPSPLAPPPGCAFHPRCPEAMPVCARRVPRTIQPSDPAPGHWVRCHLHEAGFEPSENGEHST